MRLGAITALLRSLSRLAYVWPISSIAQREAWKRYAKPSSLFFVWSPTAFCQPERVFHHRL